MVTQVILVYTLIFYNLHLCGVVHSELLSKFFEEANNETPPKSTTKVFFMNMNSFMVFAVSCKCGMHNVIHCKQNFYFPFDTHSHQN